MVEEQGSGAGEAAYSMADGICPESPVGKYSFWAAAEENNILIPVPALEAWAEGDSYPELFGGCMSRHSGVHTDYTSIHLPNREDRPPCPKSPLAIRAIFAARMAFSNFSTFRPLK